MPSAEILIAPSVKILPTSSCVVLVTVKSARALAKVPTLFTDVLTPLFKVTLPVPIPVVVIALIVAVLPTSKSPSAVILHLFLLLRLHYLMFHLQS